MSKPNQPAKEITFKVKEICLTKIPGSETISISLDAPFPNHSGHDEVSVKIEVGHGRGLEWLRQNLGCEPTRTIGLRPSGSEGPTRLLNFSLTDGATRVTPVPVNCDRKPWRVR